MKGDYSLRDLKAKRIQKKTFLKKQLSNRIRILFIVNFPMRIEIVFLVNFRLLGTPS